MIGQKKNIESKKEYIDFTIICYQDDIPIPW